MTNQILRRVLSMFIRRVFAHFVHANVQPSQFILKRQGQPKSVFIPHAVRLPSQAQKAEARDDSKAFLYCGRLIEEKGVQVLLTALSMCRQRGHDFSLRIRGEGPYKSALVGLATSLGVADRVAFVDFAHGQELVDEFRAAQALVVPSLWDEVTGIVAMEAMAAGTPVVAADVGGLGELALQGGLVFGRGDSAGLANALIAISGDPQLRAKLSHEASTAMRERYTLDRIGEQHLELLHTAVTRSRRFSPDSP
jgi:glycosyltransferase involved in cell wall biosynthesis